MADIVGPAKQAAAAMRDLGRTARGSDDEYCSAYPEEPRHHYVGHSVDAAPIRFVDRCQLCGHISSRSLRRQILAATLAAVEVRE